MNKSALITGVTGQDGSYLADLLLKKGYRVYGTYRHDPIDDWRLKELKIDKDIMLLKLDLMDSQAIFNIIKDISPNEIYNFAAQSFLSLSFEKPEYTCEIDGMGTLRLLEAIRVVNRTIRFFQASSSELFGRATDIPQTESTAFQPCNPYGVAKLFGHWMTKTYRECHAIHASCGIFFNHESSLRGINFVTRKITRALAEIKYQQRELIELGNLDAQRDWGFAGDYVRAAYLMLQQDIGDDYILATGITHTVREFIVCAAKIVGIKLGWQGSGVNEVGIDEKSGKIIIKINPEFYRPIENNTLVGSPTKACVKLGWIPEVDFQSLVEMMMEAELKRIKGNKKEITAIAK